MQKTAEISLPVAVTVFHGEIYRAPKSWTQRAYRNLVYFNEVDKGGHFAAWEQPQLFSEELRAAFRSIGKIKPLYAEGAMAGPANVSMPTIVAMPTQDPRHHRSTPTLPPLQRSESSPVARFCTAVCSGTCVALS